MTGTARLELPRSARNEPRLTGDPFRVIGSEECDCRGDVVHAADPAETEEVCAHCGGIGYYGRVGLFELLEVSPALRDALTKEPKLETLRQIVQDAHQCGLQEEGLLLVAQGITSLNELTRVLKE